MSSNPKIIAFAGSARKDSVNKKALRIAAAAAEQAGAQVTVVDLADYPMPVYNGDLEQQEGMPEKAKQFKELLKQHDGLLIASPEYNSSVSALLKNVIDWASRPEEGEQPLAAFAGKTAAILSASPGGIGGLRGLVHLRSILGNIHVLVLPEQTALSGAYQLFGEDGNMSDEKQRAKIENIGQRLAEVVGRLYS